MDHPSASPNGPYKPASTAPGSPSFLAPDIASVLSTRQDPQRAPTSSPHSTPVVPDEPQASSSPASPLASANPPKIKLTITTKSSKSPDSDQPKEASSPTPAHASRPPRPSGRISASASAPAKKGVNSAAVRRVKTSMSTGSSKEKKVRPPKPTSGKHWFSEQFWQWVPYSPEYGREESVNGKLGKLAKDKDGKKIPLKLSEHSGMAGVIGTWEGMTGESRRHEATLGDEGSEEMDENHPIPSNGLLNTDIDLQCFLDPKCAFHYRHALCEPCNACRGIEFPWGADVPAGVMGCSIPKAGTILRGVHLGNPQQLALFATIAVLKYAGTQDKDFDDLREMKEKHREIVAAAGRFCTLYKHLVDLKKDSHGSPPDIHEVMYMITQAPFEDEAFHLRNSICTGAYGNITEGLKKFNLTPDKNLQTGPSGFESDDSGSEIDTRSVGMGRVRGRGILGANRLSKSPSMEMISMPLFEGYKANAPAPGKKEDWEFLEGLDLSRPRLGVWEPHKFFMPRRNIKNPNLLNILRYPDIENYDANDENCVEKLTKYRNQVMSRTDPPADGAPRYTVLEKDKIDELIRIELARPDITKATLDWAGIQKSLNEHFAKVSQPISTPFAPGTKINAKNKVMSGTKEIKELAEGKKATKASKKLANGIAAERIGVERTAYAIEAQAGKWHDTKALLATLNPPVVVAPKATKAPKRKRGDAATKADGEPVAKKMKQTLASEVSNSPAAMADSTPAQPDQADASGAAPANVAAPTAGDSGAFANTRFDAEIAAGIANEDTSMVEDRGDVEEGAEEGAEEGSGSGDEDGSGNGDEMEEDVFEDADATLNDTTDS